MAIIEADGLFHGDRLLKCSMIAQLFWPRFYLAANGYARVEINYRSFLAGPLASFQTPPTENEVWQMFKEYLVNYLGFLYRADGHIWCQFVTEERLLPRHKTKSDTRSPEPPAKEYQEWLAEYEKTKQTTQVIDISGLPSSSEIPQKSSEIIPSTVRGVGVGGGVGEGDGKRKSQKPSAKSADEKTSDPRHLPIREQIKKCIEYATNLSPAPWDGRDAKALDRILTANPSWTADVFIGLIKNRFRSEDIPRGDPAYKWLFDLAKYANGPLDRFGKVPSDGQPNKAEQRRDSNIRAAEDAIAILDSMDRRRTEGASRILRGADDKTAVRD